MMTIDYLKQSNLNECYEIHSHYYRDWTIGDFEQFDTLEEATKAGEKRLLNDNTIRQIEIRRYFKKDGHCYYDGTKQWFQKRA